MLQPAARIAHSLILQNVVQRLFHSTQVVSGEHWNSSVVQVMISQCLEVFLVTLTSSN